MTDDIMARPDGTGSRASTEPASGLGPSGFDPSRGGHPDDLAVDRFAAKMKAKLARAREKGRVGWDDPARCSPAILSAMLHDHVAKGDPIDVANFAMMIEHYGASVAPDRSIIARARVKCDRAECDWSDGRATVRARTSTPAS